MFAFWFALALYAGAWFWLDGMQLPRPISTARKQPKPAAAAEEDVPR